MQRTVRINLEHVAGDTFRAIVFNYEGDDREVFDIIEASGANLPALLRARNRSDGHEWAATVSAPWAFGRGRARRFDVLAQRAIQDFI